MRIFFVIFLFISLLLLPVPKLGFTENADALGEGPVHNLRTAINYTSIGAAIADSLTLSGDIITVDAGIYSEHLLINKSLSLIGESHKNTTIDGGGIGAIVQVTTDGVNISNFNIKNAGSNALIYSGVLVNASRYGTFDELVIQNAGCGILLWDSNDCLIENNTILNVNQGIFALNSNSTDLKDNMVANSLGGIGINSATNCVMRRNQMINCTNSFAAGGSVLEQYLNDIDTSNTIDGKFIYYLLNLAGSAINPSTFPNAGSVTVINSTGIIVENLTLIRSGISVALAFTSDSIVRNVSAGSNDALIGIKAFTCTNLRMESNTVTDCFFGIDLSRCSETVLKGNAVSEGFIGLALRDANSNLIVENNVTNCERCIDLNGSSNNSIFHNNFLNYETAYLSDSSANAWDDGVEGNYWSEDLHVDADNDGISDAPNVLWINNVDRFPLMGTFQTFDLHFTYGTYTIHLITNSSVLFCYTVVYLNSPNEYFYPGQEFIWLRVTGDNGTQGFIRISMLRAALYTSTHYHIRLDDQWPPVNATILSASNSTYVYLYFNYAHSQHDIWIIPEFVPMVSLLFVFASSLTLIICRRKRLHWTRSYVI